MKKSLIFVFLLFSVVLKSQYLNQEITIDPDFSLSNNISMTPDGQFLALSKFKNLIKDRILIYSLVGNKFELVQSFMSEREVSSIKFSDDGNRLFVGAGLSNVFRYSKCLVYEKKDEIWNQIGETIISDESDTQSGSGVDFSADGSTFTISDPEFENHGIVRVYNYINGEWVSKGNPIININNSNLGYKVSISGDGNRLTVSSNGDSYSIKTYQFINNNWEQLTNPIFTHYGTMELSKDGNRLLCGTSGNKSMAVYELVNNNWEIMGDLLTPFKIDKKEWNTIHLDFTSDGNHFIQSLLNGSSQKTKIVLYDNIDNVWLERRNAFYDNILDNYSGIGSQISDDAKMIIVSDKRPNSNRRVLNYFDAPHSYVFAESFYDFNKNGKKDLEDLPFNNSKFLIDNSFTVVPSDNGRSFISILNGEHTIEIQLDDEFKTIGDSIVPIIVSENDIDSILFPIVPRHPITKINVTNRYKNNICNNKANFNLYISNIGTEIVNIEVDINFDKIEHESSSPVPDSFGTNSLHWVFENYSPSDNNVIKTIFQMPNENFTSDTMFLTGIIKVYDFYTNELVHSFPIDRTHILRCSYDPNDKQVYPVGIGPDNLTLFGQYLTYKIRFQNTGNLPAKDIIVKDEISTQLDLKTFEITDASHEIYTTEIENRNVKFVFSDINLADSISNEPESHGYVEFKIKPLEGLSENTIVNNYAKIFFDLNQPIITNTTINQLVTSFPTTTNTNNIAINKPLIFYPNPADKSIYFKDIKNNALIEIHDVQGRKIISKRLQNNTFDISSLKNQQIYLLSITTDNNKQYAKLTKN